MFWIISTGFAVFVFLALLLIGRSLRKSQWETRINGLILLIAAPILLIVWVGIHTGLASFHQIPAGNVGVVYQFGAIRGQIPEGAQWTAPWQSVRIANIQVQSHVFEKLDAFSEETQDTFVKAVLNIKVSPQAIQELYRTVGPNYFLILVSPRVAQNFKDETVKYKSVAIAPNRESIRQAVRERLEQELSPFSIEVVDLLLENVDFSREFKAAIEAKQIATQRALEEEQRVQVAKFQAQQAVETAKGQGGAIFAVAEKQAEANAKLSASLTPELVQYALIQKLGDQINVMILPAGQSFILDPNALVGAKK